MHQGWQLTDRQQMDRRTPFWPIYHLSVSLWLKAVLIKLTQHKALPICRSVTKLTTYKIQHTKYICTLKPLYNTIVGSHISDPYYKWTCVICDSYASCFGQLLVKQVPKVLRKCLMHTNQHGNTCFFYFYVVFPRLKSWVMFWTFGSQGVPVLYWNLCCN